MSSKALETVKGMRQGYKEALVPKTAPLEPDKIALPDHPVVSELQAMAQHRPLVIPGFSGITRKTHSAFADALESQSRAMGTVLGMAGLVEKARQLKYVQEDYEDERRRRQETTAVTHVNNLLQSHADAQRIEVASRMGLPLSTYDTLTDYAGITRIENEKLTHETTQAIRKVDVESFNRQQEATQTHLHAKQQLTHETDEKIKYAREESEIKLAEKREEQRRQQEEQYELLRLAIIAKDPAVAAIEVIRLLQQEIDRLYDEITDIEEGDDPWHIMRRKIDDRERRIEQLEAQINARHARLLEDDQRGAVRANGKAANIREYPWNQNQGAA